MCEAAALARDNKASNLDLAITTRQSVRTFRPDPVDRATVEEILALASRSPSGSNIQPWKVRVLADEPRAKLTQAILGAIASDGHEGSRREWNYYPQRWREPFLGRRRRIGWTCIGAIMTAARARRLDTRARAAFADVHTINPRRDRHSAERGRHLRTRAWLRGPLRFRQPPRDRASISHRIHHLPQFLSG
jgi:nitroreductase